MKLIDGLKTELKGFFNEISENNYVKIFDTPHIWGMPFGKEIMPKAIEREAEFEQAITSILDKMLYRCDISSLNAPDEEWRKIILAAIDKSFSEKKGRKERTQIRFLFAQTPTVLLNGVKYYFSGTPEYLTLKKDLIELIKERGKYWEGPDMRTDYKKGSEKMKEYLIKNAKKKIRMSQQDVVSAWKKIWKDHPVCHWIIEALLKIKL